MKKLILALNLLVATIALSQNDPVVLEVGGDKVTKSEFLQIYLKNNPDPQFDKAAMDEYVSIFTKFKLKVKAAVDAKYDTIPKLQRELSGYRHTLSQPYLTDRSMQEGLVQEAYDRLKKEIRASHILIALDAKASPEDTLAAYKRILALKKRIEGGEDFEQVARSTGGSEDPSVAYNGGDLGYFTAFQMVYPFEEAAYTTPKGKISDVIRTRYGYHILQVTDIRDARGTIKTAHIMVATGKNPNESAKESARKKAQEIYEKLKNGEDFTSLASQFSDDAASSQKGGELPAFGTGTTTRMVPVFEEAAFALAKNGDFSEPIETDFGYHIIKRIDLKPLASFEELKKELQAKVSKDDRAQKTQSSFLAKIKKEYKFKSKKAKTIKWFYENIDSTYLKGQFDYTRLKSDKPMFEIAKNKYTQKDFLKYLELKSRTIRNGSFQSIVDEHYANWEKSAVLDYEKSLLDAKYPEFRLLMNEYHDGVLLFEIMSDKVWNKASRDTVGLANFFAENRAKYTWGERVDAMVYECLNADVATTVYRMLEKNTTVLEEPKATSKKAPAKNAKKVEEAPKEPITSKEIIEVINKDSELNLKVMTNKYELNSTAYLKGQELVKGLNKPYEKAGKHYVIVVNEQLAPMPKELSECRGQVISEYQNYLEDTWVKELKAKYPVVIHEDVLYNLK